MIEDTSSDEDKEMTPATNEVDLSLFVQKPIIKKPKKRKLFDSSGNSGKLNKVAQSYANQSFVS